MDALEKIEYRKRICNDGVEYTKDGLHWILFSIDDFGCVRILPYTTMYGISSTMTTDVVEASLSVMKSMESEWREAHSEGSDASGCS